MTAGFSVTIKGDRELIVNLTAAMKLAEPPVITEMLKVGGGVIETKTRENIRTKLHRRPTGKLKNSVMIKVVNPFEVTIGPRGIIYAAIHEFGGIITPKRARFLRFVIDGKVIFARYVKIPARPYLRPAVRDGKRGAMKAMQEFMSTKLRKAIRK